MWIIITNILININNYKKIWIVTNILINIDNNKYFDKYG
jgi:hypothetical protein